MSALTDNLLYSQLPIYVSVKTLHGMALIGSHASGSYLIRDPVTVTHFIAVAFQSLGI